jgi:hypothetical protein
VTSNRPRLYYRATSFLAHLRLYFSVLIRNYKTNATDK